jgi:hypothetical protein
MVHPRFEDKILSGGKIHSMRKNYEFWKKRIESIMAGDGYLSLRAWAGKPRRSKQREFLRLEKVGLQKVAKRSGGENTRYYVMDVNGLNFVSTEILARNDGLSYDDFMNWFKNYPDQDMAIIHFTDFRYGR